MRSLEPLLRNLAEEEITPDPQFKAHLREDLSHAAKSHHSAMGLRLRTFAIVGLTTVLLFFLFRPSALVRSNQWLFGPESSGNVVVQAPTNVPLSQWVGQNQVALNTAMANRGNPAPASIERVVSETHFVMRQMMLKSGEMVMVLSQVPPPQPNGYRVY